MEAVEYYCKLPNDIEERDLIPTRPHVGNRSFCHSCQNKLFKKKERGGKSHKILVVSSSCSRRTEAIHKKEHPDVEIYVEVGLMKA